MSPIERSASGGGGGFSNPMTTQGDIIIENAVPAPARLAIGSTGQVLGVTAGLPAWQAPSIVQVSQVSVTSGDLTTGSTTFVNLTGVATTITTGAHRCVVMFSGAGNNNTTGDNIAVDVAIDGTRQGQAYGLTLGQSTGASSINQNLSFVYLTAALSAASHTFQIMFRVDGVSTGKIFASTTVTPAIVTVIELGL